MKDRTIHLISIIIIILFAGSTIWWMKHSYDHDVAAEHYTEHVKDYPLLDPALPFFDKKDLIVNIQEFRDYMKALPEQNKDWAEMSIYFEVMNTGANSVVNSDLKLWPASLPKLPLSMIAMRKVEKGEWSLKDTKFEMTAEDVEPNNFVILSGEIGKSYDLEFVIKKILLESDNAAYSMLVRQLKEDEVNSMAEEVGLDELFTIEGKISAKDYTRLFRALHSSTYLNHEHSQFILKLLTDSDYDKFFKAGVPTYLPIAHKWGINEPLNVYADSGIFYLKDRSYLLSIIVQGKSGNQKADQTKAEKLISELAKKSYEFMSNQ